MDRTTRCSTVEELTRGAATMALALRSWSRDEDGLQAVEWVLLLAGAVVPLGTLMFQVIKALSFFYEVTSWTVALPFP